MSKQIFMTDGEAAGVIVNGRRIYWNQHISSSTSVSPEFRRHSTTQIRLDRSDNNIIGNIRTYLNLDGTMETEIKPGNLNGGVVPSNLFEWAMDTHNTFTDNNLH